MYRAVALLQLLQRLALQLLEALQRLALRPRTAPAEQETAGADEERAGEDAAGRRTGRAPGGTRGAPRFPHTAQGRVGPEAGCVRFWSNTPRPAPRRLVSEARSGAARPLPRSPRTSDAAAEEPA
jgi:hypothetical protein